MTYAPYERLWERLLEFLSSWASAEEVAADRIRVTFERSDDQPRVVTIVMTPDDWDSIASTAHGSFDSAADEVRRWVLAIPDGHPYLVYNNQYELQPSVTETLPIDDPFPDGVPQSGAWFAYPPGEERPTGSRFREPEPPR
jgi:hypothetical protein